MVTDELLRHFWALIPVNTEEKKAKFIRIQVRGSHGIIAVDPVLHRSRRKRSAAIGC
jgi:hypothetical protein